MKVRCILSLATVSIAFSLPAVSMASSVYHPANTEAGFTTHWDHWKSNKSRADVIAELMKSGKDLTGQYTESGWSQPMKMEGTGKTREQVRQELFSMSPAEKAAQLNSNSSN